MSFGARAVAHAQQAGMNQYYTPIVEAKIVDVVFIIYGSMSWTIAEARKKGWEILRPVYVALTGDDRTEVDDELAIAVIAGELQQHWIKCTGREDLAKTVEEQQAKRIAMAIVSTKHQGTVTGRFRSTGEQNMQEIAREDGEPQVKKDVPTKGASGLAARLIQEGNLNRELIVAEVQKQFPDVKNVAPAVSWAARCCGVKLT